MKKIVSNICFVAIVLFVFSGCGRSEKPLTDPVDILLKNEDQLTQVIIYDVFTPPVSSRIYVYASLAAYEAIRHMQPDSKSITQKLHGFSPMPLPEAGKKYDFTLAATKAFFTSVRKMVFSVDSLNQHELSVYEGFQHILDKETYDRSIAFGEAVGKQILARAMNDGYIKSRGKPKYLGSNEPGKWRPTPPDYLDGVEWCWNTMKPLVLDSAAQCKPAPPPAYSTDTSSVFFREAKEVYTIGKHLSEEQRTIAKYWDDNPFVIEHSGHMMFGNKKITPGGHWMGIAAIAAKQSKVDPVAAARGFALTAVALYDAFIACWDEKYRSSVVRPVTVINELIDKNWMPFLQTPPFPEYTSGHSTITASAAAVLAELYGKNYAFLDTSDLAYIGMQRQFNSFEEAAAEASISRVYGGIHYRNSVDQGAEAGKKVGKLIIERVIK